MFNFTKRPPNRWRIRIFVICMCAALCGCLSVVRVPVPVREAYSEEGICTNRVWGVPMNDIMRGRGFRWRAYPTVRMRCMATAHAVSPIDRSKRGEDLYNERHKRWLLIPAVVLWLTSPFDAAVDTVFLPYDLSSPEKNGDAE